VQVADASPTFECPPCRDESWPATRRDCYVYLLGQYLGDGHLVRSARVPVLRIYTCTDDPAIADEVRSAVLAVRGKPPGMVRRRNSVRVLTSQPPEQHLGGAARICRAPRRAHRPQDLAWR
jgi:hypothetical protein